MLVSLRVKTFYGSISAVKGNVKEDFYDRKTEGRPEKPLPGSSGRRIFLIRKTAFVRTYSVGLPV
jgi:hypothetical protein